MLGQAPAPLMANPDWPRRLILWACVAATAFLCTWYLFGVILLVFAGTLLAIVLDACAEWVQRHTPEAVGAKLSHAATILGVVILACLIGYWIVPRAISEAGQIVEIIPNSLAQVTVYLNRKDWGTYVVGVAQRFMNASGAALQIGTITNDIGGAVEDAIVILVVGVYGALNAREYARGFLHLIPGKRKQTVAKVSHEVIATLRWWLIGQLIPMAVLGFATMLGLWFLHVPLAFTLGLVTGLMIFIPYVGSWIAFIPTVLVSLTRGPDTAIYVAILYLAIHAVEGYVLTPLVQRRTVLLPPIVTIVAQLLMWKVGGLLGVAVATPLAAVSLVLVRTLYLHEDGDLYQPR